MAGVPPSLDVTLKGSIGVAPANPSEYRAEGRALKTGLIYAESHGRSDA